MEQKPAVAALVPLRGGSKSIPLKNIKNIAGKPLCLWVLEAACNSKLIDRVYVSTDSDTIAGVVRESLPSVEIISRKADLATDTASTESVMMDFMDRVNFDILITIQATSPMTTAHDLDNAIKFYSSNGYDSLLTAVRIKRFFWTDKSKPVNYNPLNRPMRQHFDGYLMENGAFYITGKDILKKTGCRLGGKIGIYEMPQETGLEIDEPSDWKITENLLIDRKIKYCLDKIRQVKMLAMDVDGVLTDSFVYLTNDGIEMKRFSVRDGHGIGLIREMGIKTAVITKENTEIADFRAAKLKIDYIFKGIENKVEALKAISDKYEISLKNIAYIGDDLNDIEALKAAGFSAAPCDAQHEVKSSVDYICKNPGGCGCVREICEILINNHV
jgi:N-acylneuraminate cytidylyltransferase